MLLSSAADTMYWAGRYIERAGALARAVQGYERLSLDLPGGGSLDLRPLLPLVGVEPVANGAASGTPDSPLRRLVLDRENPSSVRGALHLARENLRQGRVVAPPKVWETLNTVHARLSAAPADHVPAIMGTLEELAAACDRIEGELSATMTRDEAYSFLRMGRELERADMLLRILSTLLPALVAAGPGRTFDDVRWIGFLRLTGAHAMYVRRHHTHVDWQTVLSFLVLEETFPRSVVYALHAIDRELLGLPVEKLPRDAVHRAVESARALAGGAAADIEANAARVLHAAEGVHDALARVYFPGPAVPAKNVAVSRTPPEARP